jgi:hypothetical protein
MDMPVTMASVLAKVTDPERQKRYAVMALKRQVPISRIETLIKRSEAVMAGEPPKPGRPKRTLLEGTTRERALELLGRANGKSIGFAQVRDAMTKTCCACGISDRPQTAENICQACPLPQFIKLLVEA